MSDSSATDAVKTAPTGYYREYWTGDSRDGRLVDGDGYHYFAMAPDGKITEAYEYYEADDGTEHACALPEMVGVSWLDDLGFEDMETLDAVTELDFEQVKNLAASS